MAGLGIERPYHTTNPIALGIELDSDVKSLRTVSPLLRCYAASYVFHLSYAHAHTQNDLPRNARQTSITLCLQPGVVHGCLAERGCTSASIFSRGLCGLQSAGRSADMAKCPGSCSGKLEPTGRGGHIFNDCKCGIQEC